MKLDKTIKKTETGQMVKKPVCEKMIFESSLSTVNSEFAEIRLFSFFPEFEEKN